jgi:hypothetical protein
MDIKKPRPKNLETDRKNFCEFLENIIAKQQVEIQKIRQMKEALQQRHQIEA